MRYPPLPDEEVLKKERREYVDRYKPEPWRNPQCNNHVVNCTVCTIELCGRIVDGKTQVTAELMKSIKLPTLREYVIKVICLKVTQRR